MSITAGNAFLAMVKLYHTNVYNNVQQLYKRLLHYFRYELCKELDVDDDNYTEIKKQKYKVAYETVRYLFNTKPNGDNPNDTGCDEASVDFDLVLSVEEVLKPFDFDQYENGKGIERPSTDTYRVWCVSKIMFGVPYETAILLRKRRGIKLKISNGIVVVVDVKT